MKNKFSNFIEDKIKAEFEKRNLLYKNLKKEDLSNRDSIEHIRNRFLVFLKKNLTNPKCKNSWEFLKNSIIKIEQEINNEKIQYHNDYISDESLKPAKLIIKQLETDSEEKIYENARYTISYELFNTYFLNLIMIVFIYNIALLKK